MSGPRSSSSRPVAAQNSEAKVSKFDIPTPAKIRKGALANKAVQACIAKPLAGCEALCTEAAILEGKPVVMVHQYGYISTSAFDAEEGNTVAPMLGELVEIRPLQPEDEFHPEAVRVVFDAKKFPRTNLPGFRRGKGKTDAKPPKVKAEPPAVPPVSFEPGEDNDDLARELGLL